jgi:hypothetical protein
MTLPIACSLSDRELAARGEELAATFLSRAAEQRKTESGYTFSFAADSDTLQMLVRLIDAERRCCKFLRFELTVEADAGPMTLAVTGPPGTPEFLESAFLPR